MTLGAATIIQALRLGFGRSAAKASKTKATHVTPLARNTNIITKFSMSCRLIHSKMKPRYRYYVPAFDWCGFLLIDRQLLDVITLLNPRTTHIALNL